MALTTKDRELLEAYHAGELDAAAEEELRQRLKDDKAFRQAVEKWETVWMVGTQATKAEQEERTRQKAFLGELEQQLPPVLPPPTRHRWLWLLLLILVPLLVWWIMSRGQEKKYPPSNENNTTEETILRPRFQAFDDHFFDHLPRENANLGSATEEALARYDAQEYSAAWPLLAEQVTATKDSLLLLYAGVAALGDQQARRAIGFLEPLVVTPTFVFYQEEIQWFLALAYLENKELEKARVLLTSLAVKEGTYQTSARLLLDEI
ncbi:hypothetical protein [Lewinella sp. LCG006]|uniref:hypothetical protein n=1 Tax=Lewinella sp. LCG006 TaxID=3231911 RepID=UPI00345F3F8D